MDCSFEEFCKSSDTLRVYDGEALIFASNKDGLKPMLELVDKKPSHRQDVRIFDKVVGNAAALLAVLAECKELSSPLASELAIKTLNGYSIKYHFEKVVPFIQARDGVNLCPMEKLSMGKEPGKFYEALKQKKN
jgi:iron complex outermembrane receptor protein